jgi:SH3-like domain-containing protein
MRVSTASGSLRVTTTLGLRRAMGGVEQPSERRDDGVAAPTKTALHLQARANFPSRTLRRLDRNPIALILLGLAALASVGLASCGGAASEGKDCPAADRARTVSGFCVPRYVSLKRGVVYARRGPGKDYPALWVYHVKGLPVQVVAETTDWRRVCDPDGGVAWVHRSMVDGRRTVIAVGAAAIPLYRRPGAAGAPSALLKARALAALARCRAGWCKISVSGAMGWTPAEALWGLSPTPQCR